MRQLTMTVLLLMLATGLVFGAETANHPPHVFGSYTVGQTTSVDRETQVTLRLLNPGAQAVSIRETHIAESSPSGGRARSIGSAQQAGDYRGAHAPDAGVPVMAKGPAAISPSGNTH